MCSVQLAVTKRHNILKGLLNKLCVEVEMKCRVEKDSMLTPVCLMVMDKSVEEDCQDITATQECFSPICTNLTIPVLTKQCQQTMEER